MVKLIQVHLWNFFYGVEKVNCLLIKDSEKASDYRAIVFSFIN